MRAKSFFYVSLGILALAAAYHLGARNATAQAPGNPPVVGLNSYSNSVVVTANGDVYYCVDARTQPWVRGYNVFSGSPTPTLQQSWGSVKARYRGERGAVTSKPTDR